MSFENKLAVCGVFLMGALYVLSSHTQLIEQIDSAENVLSRAVAAGLARVVIFKQQLAGEYRSLSLIIF